MDLQVCVDVCGPEGVFVCVYTPAVCGDMNPPTPVRLMTAVCCAARPCSAVSPCSACSKETPLQLLISYTCSHRAPGSKPIRDRDVKNTLQSFTVTEHRGS